MSELPSFSVALGYSVFSGGDLVLFQHLFRDYSAQLGLLQGNADISLVMDGRRSPAKIRAPLEGGKREGGMFSFPKETQDRLRRFARRSYELTQEKDGQREEFVEFVHLGGSEFELRRHDWCDWRREELLLGLHWFWGYRPEDGSTKLIQLLERANAWLHGGLGSSRRAHQSAEELLAHFSACKSGEAPADAKFEAARAVYEEFRESREDLESAAALLLEAIDSTELFPPQDDVAEVVAREGYRKLRLHSRIERDPRIVREKKARTLRAYGKLECEGCGFDFSKKYGEHGEGFIECHHMQPLKDVKEGQETRLADLALVCSNCHRMIHHRGVVLTIKQLRQLISG